MSVFLTGFPGLIGSLLLDRLLGRRRDERFVCLVQPQHRLTSERRLRELGAASERVRLVEGDITLPGLGLTDERLGSEITEIFHLAAVYDATVARSVAMAVNVDGTRHVLAFAAKCAGLRRFQHVSSFAVSGHHPGVFTEDDLDVGQPFLNHYVESKFLAEIAVKKAMAGGLPATIYRPAYVVGDTDSGRTQKYDGPYFLIRWLLRQPPWLAVVPIVGDPSRTRPNIVPRDFVVDAIAHLSDLEGSRGTVYQLVDPDPQTLDEVIDTLAEATERRVVRARVPLKMIKRALAVPAVEQLVGIPAEAMDYFDHPTRYTCAHTERDLAESGIRCPPFSSYARVLVKFVREHPEIGAGPMI